ncbi:hypothetical protein QQZ08_005900 [Neonectria magnoliae]|uniref:Uncharacterized protein n=1 Tax=Neonectria magnoliae TaxID=2732573 RepID=A0ABR1I3P7_9HYPO
MDSWRNQNYYTRNTTRWVELMNSSTAEWRIGFFPANVVAISGRLNDTYDFPSNATVIENASKTTNKKVPPESVVFIVVSIIVVLCMIWWASANRAEIFSPRKSQAWKSTEPTPTIPENFVQASEFDRQLQNFYYNGDKSLPEVREKDPRVDIISTEDIEDAGALFRKMYGLDMSLWATQNSRQVTPAERNKMKYQSDAILSEVRRLVRAWQVNMDSPHTAAATEAEQRQMAEILAQLDSISDERYPDKTPLYAESVYTGRRRARESRNNVAQ